MPVKKEEGVNPVIVAGLIAKAFDLPIAGITLLQNEGYKPFINSLGLQSAWHKHKEELVITAVTALKIYEKVGDTAIVIVHAVYHPQTEYSSNLDEIGTASPANLGDFKDYPNEIAYTRAINRVLRRVLTPILYETMNERLEKFNEADRNLVLQAVSNSKFGSVTIEELSTRSEEPDMEILLTNEQALRMKPFLERIINASNQEELTAVGTDIAQQKEVMTAIEIKRLKDAYAQRSKELI